MVSNTPPTNSNLLFGPLADLSPASAKMLSGNGSVGLGNRLFNNSFITGSRVGSANIATALPSIETQLEGLLNFNTDGQVAPNLDLLNNPTPVQTTLIEDRQELIAQLNSVGLSVESSDNLETLNSNINSAIAKAPNTIIGALNRIQNDNRTPQALPSISTLMNSGPISSGTLNIFGALAPVLSILAQPRTVPAAAPVDPALLEDEEKAIALLQKLVGEDTQKLDLIRQGMALSSINLLASLSPSASISPTIAEARTAPPATQSNNNFFNPFSLLNKFAFSADISNMNQ